MAQQQKAQPSQGMEMDRVVNLVSLQFHLVGFQISSFRRSGVVWGHFSKVVMRLTSSSPEVSAGNCILFC